MSRDSHETITRSHATDIEEDKELDIDKEKDKKKKENRPVTSSKLVTPMELSICLRELRVITLNKKNQTLILGQMILG